jgi:hypothetical protein
VAIVGSTRSRPAFRCASVPATTREAGPHRPTASCLWRRSSDLQTAPQGSPDLKRFCGSQAGHLLRRPRQLWVNFDRLTISAQCPLRLQHRSN